MIGVMSPAGVATATHTSTLASLSAAPLRKAEFTCVVGPDPLGAADAVVHVESTESTRLDDRRVVPGYGRRAEITQWRESVAAARPMRRHGRVCGGGAYLGYTAQCERHSLDDEVIERELGCTRRRCNARWDDRHSESRCRCGRGNLAPGEMGDSVSVQPNQGRPGRRPGAAAGLYR